MYLFWVILLNSIMNRKSHKLHFRRFEFKYRISEELAGLIQSSLKGHMQVDPYAHLCEFNRYEVCSLYFDSPSLNYYQEKEEGLKNRKKIRFRFYRGVTTWNAIFLEIKRKKNLCIVKDRLIVRQKDAEAFLENENFTDILKWCNKKDPLLAEEFEREYVLNGLQPTSTIIYDREPWISSDYEHCRVTFDRNIRVRTPEDFFGKEERMESFLLSSDELVMEIKFNETLPYFFKDIIQKYNLRYEPYSKYCNSIRKMIA
ncbi:MAG: hypothetical protein UW70_C0037G0018 [Candidatus Peregrinibacteria bacterium GW2011_GWA2_44_7]|nr:MAG: hypothetical protein UW70_C0037G0018 [Candidatus Peregrinibacteria bacterium GW2011_GWA2_44_7]